jgi:hypothetical protein
MPEESDERGLVEAKLKRSKVEAKRVIPMKSRR